MTPSTSHLPSDLAHRLLSGGMPSDQPAELVPATEALCARLDASLSRSIGTAGYRALVTRAIAGAAEKHAALGLVKVGSAPGVGLQGLDESIERYGVAAATEGVVAMVSEFIELLSRFVGETLAVRLIQAAWPEPVREENLSGRPEDLHE